MGKIFEREKIVVNEWGERGKIGTDFSVIAEYLGKLNSHFCCIN